MVGLGCFTISDSHFMKEITFWINNINNWILSLALQLGFCQAINLTIDTLLYNPAKPVKAIDFFKY